MTLKLYTTTDEKNKVSKTLTLDTTLTGTPTGSHSVVNPSVLIEASSCPSSNYARIEEYGRYYFINDITWLAGNTWQLNLSIDVLQTYGTAIRGLTAYVERNENTFTADYMDNQRKMLPQNSISFLLFSPSLNPYSSTDPCVALGVNNAI